MSQCSLVAAQVLHHCRAAPQSPTEEPVKLSGQEPPEQTYQYIWGSGEGRTRPGWQALHQAWPCLRAEEPGIGGLQPQARRMESHSARLCDIFVSQVQKPGCLMQSKGYLRLTTDSFIYLVLYIEQLLCTRCHEYRK